MKIGLYFGSFNPIHNGHLIIANKMYEKMGLDQVWFIPSPQNPFKNSNQLLDFKSRSQMIEKAIENHLHLKVNMIEEDLPKPSYTIDTMIELEKKYPQYTFYIIIGSDNLEHLDQWKSIDILLDKFSFHVYNRSTQISSHPFPQDKVIIYDLPLIELSSTSIRRSIQMGKSIIGEVDSKVIALIDENHWYF